MIPMLLKRYWKLVAIFILLGIISSSMYYLYKKNLSLNLSVQETEIALKASQANVQALKDAKEASDKALERNTLRQAQISSDLEKARIELRNLTKQSEISNEKGSECLPTYVAPSINDRMYSEYRKRARSDNPAE